MSAGQTDVLSMTIPKLCIYTCGRSNHCAGGVLGFFFPCCLLHFLTETTFGQDEEKCMFYKNFRRQDFNCFTISHLQMIVHNNNSDILCFVDDSCNFSEQFLFYRDLTGPCTKIMILGGGKSLPKPNKHTLIFMKN